MQRKDNSKAELRKKKHESRIIMRERVVKSERDYSRKGKNKFNFKNFDNEH